MPMDGLTLHYIVRELDEALTGGRLDKIAQPERDELQLTVRNRGKNRVLLISANAGGTARIHLTGERKTNPQEPPMFCMLLRKHLGGGRVAEIRQIEGDRILEILVENLSELGDPRHFRLVCEFMGKHSNIILVSPEGRIVDSARRVTRELSRVREVLPGHAYERPPAHGKMPFDEPCGDRLERDLRGASGRFDRVLQGLVSGLSAQSAGELSLRVLGEAEARLEGEDLRDIARKTVALLRELPAPAPELVCAADGTPLDLTAFPYRLYRDLPRASCASLSQAMDRFYRERDKAMRLSQKSASLRKLLRANIARCEKKLALQEEALEGSARMEEYRIKGELLTAAQGGVRKGQDKVMLVNYYDPDCAPLEVELDVKLSPAANAQRYFKLYQKARSARDLAAVQKEKTLEELQYLEGQLLNLTVCEEEAALNEIREEMERLGYARPHTNRRQLKKLPPSAPLRKLSSTGRDILIGRNNLQNDRLTQTADPRETWLHAKDMPGSHVIIVGEDPDETTLYEAALLAARYSKGASSSQVPVDYTLKKYVKKPSGAKPGFVIYTNQRTLYVTPSAENLAGVADRDP